MPRESFDPPPENQKVVLVAGAVGRQPEKLILGCEACSEDAEIQLVLRHL
jgi:hypothetical protein